MNEDNKCVWKKIGNESIKGGCFRSVRYISSCEKLRSDIDEKDWEYCPYCGKEIEVLK